MNESARECAPLSSNTCNRLLVPKMIFCRKPGMHSCRTCSHLLDCQHIHLNWSTIMNTIYKVVGTARNTNAGALSLHEDHYQDWMLTTEVAPMTTKLTLFSIVVHIVWFCLSAFLGQKCVAIMCIVRVRVFVRVCVRVWAGVYSMLQVHRYNMHLVCACFCSCVHACVGACVYLWVDVGGLPGGGEGGCLCLCVCVRTCACVCVCWHNASSAITILSFYRLMSCFVS